MNFKDAVKSVKEDSTKAKKNDMPVLNAPAELVKSIVNYLAAKVKKAQADAEMKMEEAPIIAFARKEQDKAAFAGQFKKSYRVKTDKEVVTYVSKDQFSVDQDAKETIVALVGKENFDKLFEEKVSVNLRPEVFTDEALQKKLMALIGDSFAEFYTSTSTVVAKTDFDKNIYDMVSDQTKLDELRTIVVQTKPSVR